MSLRIKKPGKDAHYLARVIYLMMKAEEMTIEELAFKAKVSRPVIRRFLNGPEPSYLKRSPGSGKPRQGRVYLDSLDKILSVFESELKIVPKYPKLDGRRGPKALSVPPENMAHEI